ncbi:hypothetical protein GALMADRAFT_221917 [Galerina marginata CBS 339.88]|uniref:Uncharacterized protein n=1 Tax=Galerina marginata (strain CBS 339.88) TaxID=685588 RepID=A0A067TSU2_GALM3|nr:hypothetical protein GALMADRAFT_221917 [Galerina marginata CBS 339.88]
MMKFPPEARGYLYYKPPADGRPDVSGSLRFRVLPSGSTSFDQGTDLRTPQGKHWQTLLYSIAKFDNYRPVATMLAREGLVASRTLEQLRALPAFRIRNRSVVLYSLSEPFLTDMSYMPTSLFIITPQAMLAWPDFYQSVLIVNLEKGTIGSRFPFKGLIRVRLEKSPLPQHVNTHHIVLRVLEVIEPVECVIPDYQYQIATPVAGELLMRTRLGKTKYTPWTFDLDKKGKGLEPLFKEEVKGP